jgi:hypothetical protein
MKDALGHGSNGNGGPAHMRGVMKATSPIRVKPEVVQHIQQNPGGFSVTPNGKTPTDGYMVSAPGRTKIVSESDISGPGGHRLIQQYAQDNADALRQQGAHLGGWTDKTTGKTYLDISHNIKDRNRAVSAGVKRNQIAIWDVRKQREISTGGSGE